MSNGDCDQKRGDKKNAVLVIDRAQLETRCNFFMIRAAKTWYELPETVKNCLSINGFKTAYDNWKNSTNADEKKLTMRS